MFGSNFPMDKALATYPVVVGALLDILAPRGDDLLRKVFRENAERIYRL
jgi:predicted TIM-barrel fold metal-dependent hydrolase